MALRRIRHEEEPVLRKKCRPVESFDERLHTLLDDMKETMYDGKGLGLAAVQVGVLRRAVVVDIGDGYIELINPEIFFEQGEQKEVEGCLSLPGKHGVTTRPAKVKVRAQDRSGEWQEHEGEELKARCLCHELDHLDGILFTDKVEKIMTTAELTEYFDEMDEIDVELEEIEEK